MNLYKHFRTLTIWLAAVSICLSLFSYSPSFAQSTVDITATVTKNANLRGGPGTSFAVVGGATQGQSIHIVEKNAAGDWYKLDNGQWIAAFLVEVQQSTDAPAPVGSPNITLQTIFYNGNVPNTESDEYAVIANTGTAPANLQGWQISAGTPDQTITLPSFELQPGQSCRVYTNEMHDDSCGVSFSSGQALWNNKGDCGYLYDQSGGHKSTYCYGDITGGEVYTSGAVGNSSGATANRNANLRGGPGTNYPVVGSVQNGQSLNVIAQSSAGDWYQLDSGHWIAAFLVNSSPSNTTNTVESVAPTPTPEQQAAPTPIPAPTQNPLSGQRSGAICRDGSSSSATGRGACSHHGGVDHWLYYP